MPPPPPVANNTQAAGSMPRSASCSPMRRAIAAAACFTPRAPASPPGPPGGLAFPPGPARRPAPRSSPPRPPRKRAGSNTPRQQAASVTVACSPPSPNAAGPGSAPALSGPTSISPPRTRTIEPQPVPAERRRSDGSATATPSIEGDTSYSQQPSLIAQMSELVPPMSTATTRSRPRRRAISAAPETPPAGPEPQVRRAGAFATRAGAPPPVGPRGRGGGVRLVAALGARRGPAALERQRARQAIELPAERLADEQPHLRAAAVDEGVGADRGGEPHHIAALQQRAPGQPQPPGRALDAGEHHLAEVVRRGFGLGEHNPALPADVAVGEGAAGVDVDRVAHAEPPGAAAAAPARYARRRARRRGGCRSRP